MAIKYVREDFRDRAKGVHRDLPVLQPSLASPRTRWSRIHVLSLLAVICALFILDGLEQKRRADREAVSVVEGLVADKWVDAFEDGGDARYSVELTMPYDGREDVTVIAECEEDVWNALIAGAPVSVSFYTKPRDGVLVICTITPIPLRYDSGHQDETSSEPAGADSPGF